MALAVKAAYCVRIAAFIYILANARLRIDFVSGRTIASEAANHIDADAASRAKIRLMRAFINVLAAEAIWS